MSIKYNGKTIAGNYKVSTSTTASDTKAGPIKIATEQELQDTTNNKVAVTPYLLNKALNSINRGLKIGRIGIGFINESQQQERYLNGQTIIQDQFESFTTWVKDLIKLYPNLSCTNEEFETACTLSAFGQCGKFVVDDNAGSIRLPKVVNIQGLFDLSQAGLTVEAGLPNITGRTSAEDRVTFEGAFYNGGVQAGRDGNDGQSSRIALFDASRSSSIYGKSNTVQPEAVQYPYWIQVATGAETEDNIINEIELNNPFSLLDYKYSEYELNNLSWLRSNGQFNTKIVYPAVYELLLKIYNGTETKAGVSVKLTTETFTDYDFVLNTAEETFRLPTKVKLASGKAVVGNGMALGLTDDIDYLGLGEATDNRVVANASFYGVNVGSPVSGSVTAKNDTALGVTTDPNNSGIETSSQDLYLYFYVGETVQNANLINAGRIEEKLVDVVHKDILSDRETVIGWIEPDYENGVTLPLAAIGTYNWVLVPCTALVHVEDTSNQDRYIFVSKNKSTILIKDHMCDGYNGTGHSSSSLIVPKGYYVACMAISGTAKYFPLKGVK